MSTFDPQAYTTAPQFDAPNGIALGKALVQAKPANAPANVIKAATRVEQAVAELQQAVDKDGSAPEGADTRGATARLESAWDALNLRLKGYAELPVSDYPRAARASELLHHLFPEGMTFLRQGYQAKWSASDAILRRIDAEHLAADLDSLCGPEFLAEVKKAHQLDGEALGITKRQESGPSVNLLEPVRTLRNEVAKYLRAVAGMVDDDPDTQPAVEAALKPVDEFRRKHAPHKAAPTGGTPASAPAPAGQKT